VYKPSWGVSRQQHSHPRCWAYRRCVARCTVNFMCHCRWFSAPFLDFLSFCPFFKLPLLFFYLPSKVRGVVPVTKTYLYIWGQQQFWWPRKNSGGDGNHTSSSFLRMYGWCLIAPQSPQTSMVIQCIKSAANSLKGNQESQSTNYESLASTIRVFIYSHHKRFLTAVNSSSIQRRHGLHARSLASVKTRKYRSSN